MPRLVVLSEGLTGRSHELKAEKTTIGRVEDNTFQIPDPSVSSHHCEVLLKGSDIVIRDLDSTNGTFINGQQITEATLKPSQILRLGQVEVRLEGDQATSAQKKMTLDHTQVVPQGIKMDELGQLAKSGSPGFEKKSNKGTKIFITVAILVGVLIAGGLIYVLFLS
ncbi:MAG TPA: FHA domain-containing protein [Candidatus Limnocylindria bacterium]|nr:FHA domain-containing protein [Candidatus Limnocylindria bacterium]